MRDCAYGFPCVENPNDFTPDEECCTAEEIAAHEEACKQWNEGTYVRDATKFSQSFPLDMPEYEGKQVVHVTRTPWGIGANWFDVDESEDSE